MPRRRTQPRLADVTNNHDGFTADFDTVYNALRDQIGRKSHISQLDIVPLIMACIRIVERLEGGGGLGKKQLALALITRLIRDSNMSESEKVTVQRIVETVGPSIIDGLIDADHGKLLKHGWKKLAACCSCSK